VQKEKNNINRRAWGHFVHFCNGLSPISMHKYVRKEIERHGCENENVILYISCKCFLGKGVEQRRNL
jgi:hypothetical protein